MKKIILLIVIAVFLIGCMGAGDFTVKYLGDVIQLTVYEYDWEKLNNIIEIAKKQFPEYEIIKYSTLSLNNKIVFIFEKRGK